MKETKHKKKTIASTVGTVFIDIGKLAIGSLIPDFDYATPK